jgi:hypothetical protein
MGFREFEGWLGQIRRKKYREKTRFRLRRWHQVRVKWPPLWTRLPVWAEFVAVCGALLGEGYSIEAVQRVLGFDESFFELGANSHPRQSLSVACMGVVVHSGRETKVRERGLE